MYVSAANENEVVGMRWVLIQMYRTYRLVYIDAWNQINLQTSASGKSCTPILPLVAKYSDDTVLRTPYAEEIRELSRILWPINPSKLAEP